eukprot:GHVU01007405.1.p1 GENE.GHVU01007405.1~~GHVU01007405.1.p1  ORF type:complete len:712 (-),score=105.05 GHVU01007405.1:789-2924(-)
MCQYTSLSASLYVRKSVCVSICLSVCMHVCRSRLSPAISYLLLAHPTGLSQLRTVWWTPTEAPPANCADALRRLDSAHRRSYGGFGHPLPEASRHQLDELIWKSSNMARDEEIDIEETFELTTKLGEGSFGQVWLVKFKDYEDETRETASEGGRTDESSRRKSLLMGPRYTRQEETPGEAHAPPQTFALKLVGYELDNMSEAEIVYSYAHPRVVPYHSVFRGCRTLKGGNRSSSICFLMDVADTSLEMLIKYCDKNPVRKLGLNCVGGILLDIARAMEYLHRPSETKPHLLHRDLKPANILINKTTNGYRAFVTDFGISRQFIPHDHEMTRRPGTEGYIAPEQRYSRTYDRPADVWSFGVIVARMLGVSWYDQFSSRPATVIDFPVEDPFLPTLALNCLENDPLLRPTFSQVVRDITDELFRVQFEGSMRQVAVFGDYFDVADDTTTEEPVSPLAAAQRKAKGNDAAATVVVEVEEEDEDEAETQRGGAAAAQKKKKGNAKKRKRESSCEPTAAATATTSVKARRASGGKVGEVPEKSLPAQTRQAAKAKATSGAPVRGSKTPLIGADPKAASAPSLLRAAWKGKGGKAAGIVSASPKTNSAGADTRLRRGASSHAAASAETSDGSTSRSPAEARRNAKTSGTAVAVGKGRGKAQRARAASQPGVQNVRKPQAAKKAIQKAATSPGVVGVGKKGGAKTVAAAKQKGGKRKQ